MAEPTVQEQKELIAFQEKGVASNSAPLQKEDVDTLNMMDKQKVDAEAKVESKIQEMKEKGTTKEEFLATAESSGEDYVVNQDLVNRIAGELPSTPETKKDSNLQALPPASRESEFTFDFSNDAEFNFDFTEEFNVGVKKERTPSSKKELSLMASLASGMPFDYISNQALQGDESLINQAFLGIDNKLKSQGMAKATEAIAQAKTPQDVITFLSKLKESQDIPPTLSEQRTAYVESLGELDDTDKKELNFDNISPILQYTLKNNIIAADVQKQQTEYQNSQTYTGMALDFLEIVIPFSGAGEEEFSKYTSEIYKRADEFNDMEFTAQRALVKELVETATTSETLLFNNNNSFMQGGQIGTFYRAILEGGLNDPDSNVTAAERGALLETAFNGTIFVGEGLSLVKNAGNLIKFLMRRIHSNKVLKAGVAEEEKWARLIIQRQAAFQLDPNTLGKNNLEVTSDIREGFIKETSVDSRVGLQEQASLKGTRKDRKVLETEKRNLGKLKGVQAARDISKEARALSTEKKIKFKEARKEIIKDQSAQVKTIDNRQKVNQEFINDFDKAAKAESDLSRIGTKLGDGRITLSSLQKADGGFEATGYTGFYRTVPQREGASVFDSQFAFSPKAQYKVEEAVGIKGMPEAMNMTKEQVAERLLPTLTPETDIGLNNVANPRSLNDQILADDTLANIGMRLGRELERANGTSLTPVISGTKFGEGTTDSSLGTFTFILGDGAQGGFKKLADAQKSAEAVSLGKEVPKGFKTRKGAQSNVNQAALGYDYKIVKKETGYYVEMEVEHYTNPFNDTKSLDIKAGTTPSKLTTWALNHARIVEEDMIRGLYALKGVNRSVVQKLEKKAKDAMFLRPEKNQLLMKILEAGDRGEMEWATLKDIQKEFGKVPQDVFDSYRALRDIYDDIYIIRERNYYNALRAAKQKVIYLGPDMDNSLGKVIKPKDLEGDKLVYDTVTKQLVPKDEILESDILVELGETLKLGGTERTYVRVQPKDVRKLNAGDTLNMRIGHVDRMYRDAGWVVKKDNIRNINGVDVNVPKITNIVKTEKEARALENTEEGIFASPSRENNELDFAKEDSVQFGPSASHTKKRGEGVKGADGTKTAGVLNAFESLFATIGSVQNSLDFNVMKATEVKFFKAFEGILKQGSATRFENDISKMYIEKEWNRLSQDMRTEFINHHSYLKSLRHFMWEGWMKSADEVTNKIFNKVGVEVSSQKAIGAIQQKTSVLGIVWNGLYQAGQNTIEAMYAIASSPRYGGKAVMTLPSIMAATVDGDLRGLAKILGSDSLAEELFTELGTNGLIDAVGRSNDFLDLARTAGGNVAIGKVKASVKIASEATMFPTLKRASQGIQETPLVVGNALAYLTEFFELTAKNGGVFKGREKAEISFQAQKRMLTQNSLDQFWFQNRGNPLSFVGQFMQAVYKTILDNVIEAQWEFIRKPLNVVLKPITDRELGSLGKNVSRRVDTFNKAFIVSAITYTLFGPEGGMGKSLGSSLEDFVRSQYETTDDMPPLLDGFFNGMASELANGAMKAADLDGKVDINQTMSPSAFLDMFSSLVAGDFPQVNLLGASAFMLNNVAESAYSSTLLTYDYFANGNLGTMETLALLSQEMTEPFKLLDTAQKAYIAYNTGRNASSGSLSSDDRLTKTEAIASFFGFEPELLTDKMYRMKFSQGDGTGITDMAYYARKNTNMALQQYARQLTYEMDMGTLTREGQQALYVKWINIAKGITGKAHWNSIETSFSSKALKETPPSYNETIKPQVTGKTLDGIIKVMRITSQKADGHSEEAEAVLNNLRENYELMQGNK